MIAYRTATPADSAALARIGADSFTQTFGHLYDPADLALFLANHTPEGWASELADPSFAVRVAEDDGLMAAFIKLGPPHLPFAPSVGSLELRQLYVLAPWQGTGVSAALTEWLIAEARTRNASELYLSVFENNHRARRFYARYGFTDVGPYTFMVGNHADQDIVMRLTL